jgi:hypothetical protein
MIQYTMRYNIQYQQYTTMNNGIQYTMKTIWYNGQYDTMDNIVQYQTIYNTIQ